MHPVAVHQNQGLRREMEDRHIVVQRPDGSVFGGVYDGHGGTAVADLLVGRLHGEFFKVLDRTGNAVEAFIESYATLEQAAADFDCGATAATFYIHDRKVVHAGVGDCSIFVSGSETRRLTAIHRISNPEERRRILESGAFIQDPYFVHQGRGLMPTRSFGDPFMRPVGLHAKPEIGVYALSPVDCWILATSDGVTDTLGTEIIDEILKTANSPEAAASLLIDEALARGGSDNMTVVLCL